jgi:hypothetical protein
MTVGELRKRLQGIPPDVQVELELCDDEGVMVACGDLQVASLEERCDEMPRFYMWGEHGKVREPEGEPRGELELVP